MPRQARDKHREGIKVEKQGCVSVLREAATAASKRAASQKVAAVLGRHFEGLLEAERLAKAKVRKRSFTANC
eukprot:COSAG06_NODE_53082_length_302_cov_0.743842_1_plen_71_part_10